MRFRLIILIWLIPYISFGNVDTRFQEYNCRINRAELAILDSNYLLAKKEYELAQLIRVMFIKDRYNYAVCCALTKDYKKCDKEISYITGKGGNISVFKNNPAFSSYFRSRQSVKPNKKCNTGKTYNQAYRKEIDSLVYMDQLFRIMPGGYDLYGDTIKKIDSSNAVVLKKLIELYGFPTEEIIGIDSLKFNRPIYELLILHNRPGAKYRSYDFTSIFQQALDSGWIEVHAGADLVEMCKGATIWGNDLLKPVQCIYDSTLLDVCYADSTHKTDYSKAPIGFFSMKPENEKKYNDARAEYCLEPIPDVRQKAIYQLKDKRFDFTYSKLERYITKEKGDYERMKKQIIYPN